MAGTHRFQSRHTREGSTVTSVHEDAGSGAGGNCARTATALLRTAAAAIESPCIIRLPVEEDLKLESSGPLQSRIDRKCARQAGKQTGAHSCLFEVSSSDLSASHTFLAPCRSPCHAFLRNSECIPACAVCEPLIQAAGQCWRS